MPRLPCQRDARALIAVLMAAAAGSTAVLADDAKLVADCGAPAAQGDRVKVSCAVRSTGRAEFRDVTAKVKGQSEGLEAKFTAASAGEGGSVTTYLVQIMPSDRRRMLAEMADAVVTLADRRKAKRRFSAYSFANDLTFLADSGVSRDEFARQVIALKPASGPVELYKSALKAVEALAKETAARKALVIVGDGRSDDMGYTHDQVVKAARDGGVNIHALGFFNDADARPNFQKLSRLADETGGYAVEAKLPAKPVSTEIVSGSFPDEVIENGGTVDVTLKGGSGEATLVFTAEIVDRNPIATEVTIKLPGVPAPDPSQFAPPPTTEKTSSRGISDTVMDFLSGSRIPLFAVGLGIGLAVLAFRRMRGLPPAELVRNEVGEPVIYGWLEGMNGSSERFPLKTTNVRVGRHRDNDICIANDSISRRHAVIHFNADTRRFVITDLGAGNGVVVNKAKYQTRELNDGDVVELGDVKLKFRSEGERKAS